jgi:hypothetical protein
MQESDTPAEVGSMEGLGGAWRSEPAPTHRCTVCGALWRYWPERDTGHPASWNMRSGCAGDCCRDAPMGEQIKPVTLGELERYLRARLAVDVMVRAIEGPQASATPMTQPNSAATRPKR